MKVHGIEDFDDFLVFLKKIVSPEDIKIMKQADEDITRTIVEEEADEDEVERALLAFYGLGTLFGIRLIMEAFRENLLGPISRETCPIGVVELIIKHREKKKKESQH